MKVGKLSNEDLAKIILGKVNPCREEVIVRPAIGEDCAVIDFGKYACVLSSDPITGTTAEIGRLAVNVSCNDIAASGTEPLGIMVTILAPEGTTLLELDQLMAKIVDEANKLNVEIIGGHTEITSAVNRMVVSTTAIGRNDKDKIVRASGAESGDMLIMTKTAGLEGTGIIIHQKEEELAKILTREEIKTGKSFLERASVVKEGRIAAKVGVTAMHDVTEGGLLGAIWEICQAGDLGCMIDGERINVDPITEKICLHFNIDPLKLISSGTMLIAVSSENIDDLMHELEGNGIRASWIGRLTSSKKRYITTDDGQIVIDAPVSDELYKVVD